MRGMFVFPMRVCFQLSFCFCSLLFFSFRFFRSLLFYFSIFIVQYHALAGISSRENGQNCS
jgi:hypothetical protein